MKIVISSDTGNNYASIKCINNAQDLKHNIETSGIATDINTHVSSGIRAGNEEVTITDTGKLPQVT